MKFTIALPLTLATLGVAAPTIEKREVGTVTLYTATRYGGQSTTLTIDTNKEYIPGSDPPNLGCMNIPSSFNNRVLSLKINPKKSTFFCRLYNNAACAPDFNDNTADTWNIYEDVPDLNGDIYTIGNRASSIYCASTAG